MDKDVRLTRLNDIIKRARYELLSSIEWRKGPDYEVRCKKARAILSEAEQTDKKEG